MKYAFIHDELAGDYPIRMICHVLKVSPSGYHRFLKMPMPPRKAMRPCVEAAVVQVHVEPRRIYGAPKIAHELPRMGVRAHRNTVPKIMRERGIRAKFARRYRPTTTQSRHPHAVAPNVLDRGYRSPEAFEAAAKVG